MTSAEAVEFIRPQLEVARELGFPLLRLHAGIPADSLEALVPVAEDAGITLATELQGGQTPDGQPAASLLELRERLDSPAIAIALDFSVAMTGVPAPFVDAVLAAGTAPEDVDSILELWESGASTPELFGALGSLETPRQALLEAQSGFVRFGRQEPEAWAALVPAIAYAHAKFWLPDDDGKDPTVRTAELLDVLAQGGFEGVVATEWGGNAWLDVDHSDAFSIVSQHSAFCRAQISEPALEVPARP